MGFTRKKKKKRENSKFIIIYVYRQIFFSIREKKIGWISFFARKFAGRRKGFRRKRNFIGRDDQSFERKWGRKKSFLDRVEATTASMQ